MDGDFIHDLVKENSKIRLRNTTYYMSRSICVLNTNNVSFIGNNTKIVFPEGVDGFVVKESDNFKMRGIKVIIKKAVDDSYANVALVVE